MGGCANSRFINLDIFTIMWIAIIIINILILGYATFKNSHGEGFNLIHGEKNNINDKINKY